MEPEGVVTVRARGVSEVVGAGRVDGTGATGLPVESGIWDQATLWPEGAQAVRNLRWKLTTRWVSPARLEGTLGSGTVSFPLGPIVERSASSGPEETIVSVKLL